MTKFGICGKMTAFGMQPVPLARRLEGMGFESLWFGEHTHTPDPERLCQRDPTGYDELYDPYAVLAACAAVTERINLGVSVSLVPLHKPISLAKMAATLDVLSNGRFHLGVGAGYRVGEIEDFGVRFEERWKVLRENVLAMRAIWTQDLAEFHGKYVDFGPMKAWPKPVRAGGVPVLEGSFSKFTARRIAEYGDGWLGWDGMSNDEVCTVLGHIKDTWAAAGKAPDALDLTMIARVAIGAADADERMAFYKSQGFGRIVLLMTPDAPDAQIRELDWFASLMHTHGGTAG